MNWRCCRWHSNDGSDAVREIDCLSIIGVGLINSAEDTPNSKRSQGRRSDDDAAAHHHHDGPGLWTEAHIIFSRFVGVGSSDRHGCHG